MKSHLRLPCGATALAGLCLWAAVTAAPPELPKDTAKAATAADVAELQKKLDLIAANPEKTKGAVRTAKGLVLTLGVYGDEATQGQAAKVLLALDKKDYKGAVEAGKALSSPKADPAALKAIQGKYDLEDVMSQFRLTKSGPIVAMVTRRSSKLFRKAVRVKKPPNASHLAPTSKATLFSGV